MRHNQETSTRHNQETRQLRDINKRHLRAQFPELTLDKLQKVHTAKVQSYRQWMAAHARERTYSFQLRKCEDVEWCMPPPPRLPRDKLIWLPDPELEDAELFLKYEQVKGRETTEKVIPSQPRIMVQQWLKRLHLRIMVQQWLKHCSSG